MWWRRPGLFPAMGASTHMRFAWRPIGAAALLAIAGCSEPPPAALSSEGPSDAVHPQLAAHSALFDRTVLNPVDGVYVAVGFGLANSIMIEGDDGIVIVDTMESRSEAQAVLRAFREITAKPVAAIVLTHNHTDHIFGGQVFAEGRDVPVFAHRSTNAYIDRIFNVIREAIYVRSMRMFGQLLAPADVENAGIGPGLHFEPEGMALLRPTRVFDDVLDVDVAGIRLRLVHAPGETPDQLFVWLADREVLLPGDNVYQTFPNLYTIRGTAHRDLMTWVRSIDAMRDLRPAAIVPSHTRPVVGHEAVMDVLTAYRDAIQYVHDQSVRGINRGMTPDELVAFVNLPAHLAGHPWLVEHYGMVDWSVRSVFAGYLGWYDGDAASLEPMAPAERARRYMSGFADGAPLPDQAREALAAGELDWATELAHHWVNAEPSSGEARDVLATVLEERARIHINPNARHYYLTQSQELRGEFEIEPPAPKRSPDDFVDDLPIEAFMQAMPTRLRAEEALDVDLLASFEFTDVGRTFAVHIRHGVAEVRERAVADPALRVVTTARTWKRIAAGKRSPALAFATGELDVDGGAVRVARFLALFDR